MAVSSWCDGLPIFNIAAGSFKAAWIDGAVPVDLGPSPGAWPPLPPATLPSQLWAYGFDLAGIESEAVSWQGLLATTSGHGRRSSVGASRWRKGRAYPIRRPTTAQGVCATLVGYSRADGWEQFYLRVDRRPTAGDLRLWAADSDQLHPDPDLYLNLTTAGFLKLYDGSVGSLGLSLAALTVGVWYRMAVFHQWRTGVADGRVRLFLDGVEQFDAPNLVTGYVGQMGALWAYSYLSQFTEGATPHYADGEVNVDDWTATPTDAPVAGRIDTLLPTGQGTHDAWIGGVNSWKALVRHPDTGPTVPDVVRSCSTSEAKTTVTVDVTAIVGTARTLKVVADGLLENCKLLVRVDGVETIYLGVWDSGSQLLMVYIPDPGLTAASVVEIGVQKDATATARALRGLWAIVDYAKADAAEDAVVDDGASCAFVSYAGNGALQDVALDAEPHMLWVLGSNGVRYFWHDGLARINGLLMGQNMLAAFITNISADGFTVVGGAGSLNETGVTYFVMAVHDPVHDLVRRGDAAFGSIINGTTVALDDVAFLPEWLLLASRERSVQ